MKRNYIKDIRIMSSFQQMINALSIIINIIRVVAVVFLILQAIVMVTRDKA